MVRMMTDQELREVLRADRQTQTIKERGSKRKNNVIELRSCKNER